MLVENREFYVFISRVLGGGGQSQNGFSTREQLILDKSSAVAEMGDRGHNRHGPERGGAVPLSRSAGNPSNTMWPEPMSTSVPSGVFIHPAVWPQ